MILRQLLLRILGLDPGRDWLALEEACAEHAARRLRRAIGWSPAALERHHRDAKGCYTLMVWRDGSRWSCEKGWQKTGPQGVWS